MVFVNLTWQSKHRISHKTTFHIRRTYQWITILLCIIIDLILLFNQKSRVSRFSRSNYKISLFQLWRLCFNSLFIVKWNILYVLQNKLLLSIDNLLITVKSSKVRRLFFLWFWEYKRNMPCFLGSLRRASNICITLLSDEEFVGKLCLFVLEFEFILSSFQGKNDFDFFFFAQKLCWTHWASFHHSSRLDDVVDTSVCYLFKYRLIV